MGYYFWFLGSMSNTKIGHIFKIVDRFDNLMAIFSVLLMFLLFLDIVSAGFLPVFFVSVCARDS